MRHAGVGWPVGAVNNAIILALPSPVLLMCATEGRYHHDAAVRAGKRCIWRAIPRHGKRPAELKYNAGRFADEVMNLTEEATEPIREMIAWNEPDLQDERGDGEDDWSNLDARYSVLGQFQLGVLSDLRRRLPGVVLHYGAWTPDHDAIGHIRHWIAAAHAADVVDFHAYDTLDKIRGQYDIYRAAFPDKRLFLAEYHGKGDLEEERRILQWLAETAAADPLFDGAAFFIWDWPGAPGWWSTSYDIAHNPGRLALFRDPPTVVTEPEEPEEPMTRDEVIALIVRKAQQHAIEPYELLAGAIAESALNPTAARFGNWPDVSFGLFQQTVKFAAEGDHTESAENVALIKRLYFDPEHACDVAAGAYKHWRHDPDVPPLTAWVAYNGPSFYHSPEASPNVNNYRRALSEAQTILGAATVPKVTFNAQEPAIAQNDPWSCAPTSTRWALTALGRHPDEAWLEGQMIADGVVTKEDGLLDADGARLAQWITDQYGEYGYYANSEPRGAVSFDGLALEGGHAYPLLIGGTVWGHWSGVRGYDAGRDLLLLANPADGWKTVGQTMDRRQFAALGPFSMIRVLHPDLLEALDDPEPPKIPPKLTMDEVVAELERILAKSSAEHEAQSIRMETSALLERIR